MSKTDVTQSNFLDGIKTNTRLAVIVGIIMLACGFLAIGSSLAASPARNLSTRWRIKKTPQTGKNR